MQKMFEKLVVLRIYFLREAKGGWRGKLVLQTGRPGRRQRLICNDETQYEIEFPIQVDYNEEKSGVKKKYKYGEGHMTKVHPAEKH